MAGLRVYILGAFLLFGGVLASWNSFASSPTPQSIYHIDEALETHSKELSNRIRRLYSDGVLALALDSSTTQAKDTFLEVLKLDSAHGPSLYELAGINLHKNDSLALAYMKRAFVTDTSNLQYKTRLAMAHIFNNNYEEALTLYKSIAEQDPNNPANFHTLSVLYVHTNMPYTALSVLDSAESRFGKIPEFTATKRHLYTSLKLYHRAEQEALTAIENSPDNTENLLILAEIYAAQRKDSLAEAYFDKAIDLQPTNPNLIVAKSNYYNTIGDSYKFLNSIYNLVQLEEFSLDKKIDLFNNYVLTPKTYKQYRGLITNIAATIAIKHHEKFEAVDLYASFLAASGNADQAAIIFKNQLSKPQHKAQACQAIIQIETMLNRVDSVEKYSEMAIELQPDNVDHYLLRSGTLRYMKRFEKAREVLLKATKYATTDSLKCIIYGSLGDLWQETNEYRKAERCYKKSLRYDPRNAMILNNYAYMLSQQSRDLDKALEMTVLCNQIELSNPTYLDTHAWVLYKKGSYEEAKAVMRTAISLDRKNSKELFVHYGDILFALGDEFMAVFYWKKALERGYSAQEIEIRIDRTKKHK